MSHSAGYVPGEHEVEAFDHRVKFDSSNNRKYWVERTDDAVIHHELITAADGEVIHDNALPVRLFLGSGTRGKSYAVQHSGLLYQSPISWFAGDGGRWDLSPGFRGNITGFQRRIVDKCMMCHAGRIAVEPDAVNTF